MDDGREAIAARYGESKHKDGDGQTGRTTAWCCCVRWARRVWSVKVIGEDAVQKRRVQSSILLCKAKRPKAKVPKGKMSK